MTFLPDQTFKEQQQVALLQEQQAINALSPNRQSLSTSNLTNVFGTFSTPLSTPAFLPVTQSAQTFGRNTVGISNSLFGQQLLGTVSTRPSSLPGLPTSFGLPIGTFDATSPQRLPGASTNFAQTINDIASGTQRTIRGVVDSVSNGTTQTVAGSDDSGTGLISSPVAETPYQSPETSDLISEPVAGFNANNDFFG